ncbi:MAG: TlpA family protein disulfide reductase [Adhaeribacter sp.]
MAGKRYLLLLCLLVQLFSCRQHYKLDRGTPYTLNGEVAGCEGCPVQLQLYDYSRFKSVNQHAIQTDTVKQGRFLLKGKMARAGFYQVQLRDLASGRRYLVTTYLPSEPIHIRADLNGLPPGPLRPRQHPDVQGVFSYIEASSSSPTQQEVNRYFLLVDSLEAAYQQKSTQILAAFRHTFTSGNKQLISQWGDSVRASAARQVRYRSAAADLFIRRYPRSQAAILAMLDNHHDKTTNYRFNRYFQALPLPQQTSYYGQILAKKLTLPDKPAKSRQHWVGSSITYLKGKTPAGQELDVQQVFRRNKLTLVNFWASWHGPSRWQMAAYQKLYRQHRRQGFEIVAVSFDNHHAAWTKAISEEGLAFPQLSELKGQEAEEYRRFRIRDIPFNILFDEKGTMVAVDLSPEEVASKLEQWL